MLAPAGTCGPADEQLSLDRAAAQLVMTCLTNYARAQSGLKPLQLNTTLSAAGNAKLGADVSCGVFSHEPCGKPFDAVFAAYLQGATSFQIGENIAWGTGSYGTPRQIMLAWLHSSGPPREHPHAGVHRGRDRLPRERGLPRLSGRGALVAAVRHARTGGAALTRPASAPKPKKLVVTQPAPHRRHAKLHRS